MRSTQRTGWVFGLAVLSAATACRGPSELERREAPRVAFDVSGYGDCQPWWIDGFDIATTQTPSACFDPFRGQYLALFADALAAGSSTIRDVPGTAQPVNTLFVLQQILDCDDVGGQFTTCNVARGRRFVKRAAVDGSVDGQGMVTFHYDVATNFGTYVPGFTLLRFGHICIVRDAAGDNFWAYMFRMPIPDDQTGMDCRTQNDDDGVSAAVLQGIGDIPNSRPVVSFTYSCTGLSCDFFGSADDIDGQVASWSWTFGDGAGSGAQTTSHTYSGPGQRLVRLSATDDDGGLGESATFVSLTLPLEITSPATLPNGTVLQYYSYQFTATGGNGSYSWGVAPGDSLPTGLNLAGNGLLSGTPQASGTHEFSVRVTSGETVTTDFSLTIQSGPLAVGFVLEPSPVKPYRVCTWSAWASGGTGSYTYTWFRAGKPAGSGSPVNINVGTSSFWLRVRVQDGVSTVNDSTYVYVTYSSPSYCTY